MNIGPDLVTEKFRKDFDYDNNNNNNNVGEKFSTLSSSANSNEIKPTIQYNSLDGYEEFLNQLDLTPFNAFSESESKLVRPTILDLDNENNNAEFVGDQNDIDNRIIQEEEEEQNKQSYEILPTTMFNNNNNNNNNGLKYTRSIGGGGDGDGDDLDLQLANRYNNDNNIQRFAFPLVTLPNKSNLPIIKGDRLLSSSSSSKLFNGKQQEEQQQQQQIPFLKNRLLLDRIIFNNYLNKLYATSKNRIIEPAIDNDVDADADATTATAAAIAFRLSQLESLQNSNSKTILPRINTNKIINSAKKNDNDNNNNNEDDGSYYEYLTKKLSNNNNNNQLVHLFAIMAAILGACLAVKFVLRGSDKQLIRRNFSKFSGGARGSSFRSIWSSKSDDCSCDAAADVKHQQSISGKHEVVEQKHHKPLSKANFITRRFSTNKEEEEEDDDKKVKTSGGSKKSLDNLTQKLIWLLRSQQCRHSNNNDNIKVVKQQKKGRLNEDESDDDDDEDDDNCQDEKKFLNNDNEIIEVDSISTTSNAQDGFSSSGSFRSSRSYIKSLIDVLSNAKSHMSNVSYNHNNNNQMKKDFNQNRLDEVDTVNDDDDDKLKKNCDSDCVSLNMNSDEAGIVMSQMDISAAHLILAYMEKHLEDKERLKREWLELNSNYNYQIATSPFPPSSKQHQQRQQNKQDLINNKHNNSIHNDGNKIKQLMLQRLAKVALNEENKIKNRNPLVVPFDRNRVKLFSGLIPSSSSSSSSPPYNSNSSFSSGLSTGGINSKQLKNNNNNKKSFQQQQQHQQRQRSDYINASYIYDDDPRRPTHIIAQGPTEQTAGQFWQMIWEQGISVIVMLTRLNENSLRMCHCYWPTNVVGQVAQQQQQQQQQTSSSQANSKFNNSSSNIDTLKENQAFNGNNIAADSASSNSNSNILAKSTSNHNANGRRGSVTSVFNGQALRLNANNNGNDTNNNGQMVTADNINNNSTLNGQPIIANGDLTNNMLIFDISCNNSLDEEDEQQQLQKDNTIVKNNNSNSYSNLNTNNNKNGRIRFEIHLVSEHVSSNDYLVRNMYMINRTTGETRTITQFHYLSWPLNGVPDNAKSLLSFRRKVHKSYRDLKSPILVHCSDGAGRSGTYTLIDIILERIKNGAKEIDPRATLEHLRDQRIGLCSTQSQFEFVLVALAEEIQLILNALPQ